MQVRHSCFGALTTANSPLSSIPQAGAAVLERNSNLAANCSIILDQCNVCRQAVASSELLYPFQQERGDLVALDAFGLHLFQGLLCALFYVLDLCCLLLWYRNTCMRCCS